jgi:hypothetical protein
VRYICLIYEANDPTAEMSEADQKAQMAAYGAFTQEVLAAGVMQAGDALQPPQTATSVRVQGGETLTTDGPFAETKEWLAGFYILECENLDTALEYAAKIPAAEHGTIEVRPIVDLPPEYANLT